MQNFVKLYRPKFDAAKAIYHDRKICCDAVNPNELAFPVSKKGNNNNTQFVAWRNWLSFEQGNPEQLDPINLKSRIRFVFELCLSSKLYYPELWYQYATFEKNAGDVEAATQIYYRATKSIPHSELLTFAFADHQELRNDIDSAKEIYENFLKLYPSALVYINYQRFARRSFGAKGLEEARSIFKRARKDRRENACSHYVYTAAGMYYLV